MKEFLVVAKVGLYGAGLEGAHFDIDPVCPDDIALVVSQDLDVITFGVEVFKDSFDMAGMLEVIPVFLSPSIRQIEVSTELHQPCVAVV